RQRLRRPQQKRSLCRWHVETFTKNVHVTEYANTAVSKPRDNGIPLTVLGLAVDMGGGDTGSVELLRDALTGFDRPHENQSTFAEGVFPIVLQGIADDMRL